MLVATHNPGKVREFALLMRALHVDLVGLAGLGILAQVQETGSTFAENALIKARAYAALSGQTTLADDSGLEVDALEGRPGVLSARYAGPTASDLDRNILVLRELESVPAGARTARFRCALAVAWPDGRCILTTGTCEGEIAFEPRGANGFGYDPIFYIPALGFTMAELPTEAKNELSHRARAARALLHALQTCARGWPL